MNEALFDIKEKGIALYLNEQSSIICPFCEQDWVSQGKPVSWKPYKSMSISRVPAGILYVCHRATCSQGNKGGLVSDTLGYKRPGKPKQFEPKLCTHTMEFIPDGIYKRILANYYIDKDTALIQGFRYIPSEQRLYMPIFSKEGYTIGGVAKTLVKGLKPKTILYRHNNVPMLHYPKEQTEEGPLILVEDILSAVRLKVAGYRAAALQGTHISQNMLKLLIKNERSIVLMLDGDASAKAIAYKKKFSNYFLNFSVVLLSNLPDAKELTEEQLRKLFNLSPG